jgi:hypothetical protein
MTKTGSLQLSVANFTFPSKKKTKFMGGLRSVCVCVCVCARVYERAYVFARPSQLVFQSSQLFKMLSHRRPFQLHKVVRQLFMDFKIAYDSYRTEVLYNELGITMKIVRIIRLFKRNFFLVALHTAHI